MMISVLVALVIANSGFRILQTQFEEILPRMSELTLNWFTVIAAIFFATLFAITFAFISSKMINYRALNSLLQSSGKGTGIQVSKRFRQVLIVAQVSIATVLVFASIGLFNESIRTINEPLGFEVDNMVTADISYSTTEPPSDEDMSAAMASLKTNLLNLPQVKSVSQSDSPLSGFSLNGMTDPATNRTFTPDYKNVDASYFEQIGQPLIAGNFMSEADVKDGNQVAIVNDIFAKKLREDGNVVGMKIDSSGDTYTIIGIVKTVKLPADERVPNRIYFPSSLAFTTMNLTLEPNQSITREQVVSAIRDVSHSYALFDLQILLQTKKDLLILQRTAAATTAALAIITLFLASVGLYGILSYGTQMRRFEIGTRMAIGAKRLHLIKMIIKENSSVVTIGVLVSLLTMLVIYVLNKESLAGYVDVNLVPAFVATLLAITSLALFACYWPLRKYINNPAIHLLRGND
jgi:ABC-type antimicrobial peptide transport system permease subunit